MPLHYDDACALILDAPAPVLYLDTCIFLDLVRAPVSEGISSDTLSLAQELRTRSSADQRSIWLVTSETVQMEWQDNIDAVKTLLSREIRKLESSRKHFLSAAQSATGAHYQHGQIESALDLPDRLEAESQALLDASIVIAPEQNHLAAAMTRLKANKPPAKRGKAEPKDCEIYELFLSFSRDIRAEGMDQSIVFASSNKNEFGKDNNGGVQSEMDPLNCKYVSNIPWAMATIFGSN